MTVITPLGAFLLVLLIALNLWLLDQFRKRGERRDGMSLTQPDQSPHQSTPLTEGESATHSSLNPARPPEQEE